MAGDMEQFIFVFIKQKAMYSSMQILLFTVLFAVSAWLKHNLL